jgi:hypothetical protein
MGKWEAPVESAGISALQFGSFGNVYGEDDSANSGVSASQVGTNPSAAPWTGIHSEDKTNMWGTASEQSLDMSGSLFAQQGSSSANKVEAPASSTAAAATASTAAGAAAPNTAAGGLQSPTIPIVQSLPSSGRTDNISEDENFRTASATRYFVVAEAEFERIICDNLSRTCYEALISTNPTYYPLVNYKNTATTTMDWDVCKAKLLRHLPPPIVEALIEHIDPAAVFILRVGQGYLSQHQLSRVRILLTDPLRRFSVRNFSVHLATALRHDIFAGEEHPPVENEGGNPGFDYVVLAVDLAEEFLVVLDAMRQEIRETVGDIPEGAEGEGFIMDRSGAVVNIRQPYNIFSGV